jgi:hypothetical protein
MSDSNYSTGFMRPPQHSRFKKGQSGNPRGRVRGRKNYRADLLEELAETVTVTENGRQLTISKQKLIIKRMVADAAKGNHKALEQLLRYLNQAEAQDDDATSATPVAADAAHEDGKGLSYRVGDQTYHLTAANVEALEKFMAETEEYPAEIEKEKEQLNNAKNSNDG